MQKKNITVLSSRKKSLKNNLGKALIIFFPCFVFLILLIIFSRGYLILGGEGNYIINFQLIRNVGAFSWVPHINGIGFPSFNLNNLVGIFDFFSFLQRIGLSMKIINIISAWLVYVLPFLAMMWLLGWVLKIRFFAAYIISLFYVLNPFSTYHLQGLMFWNVAPLFVLPLIFGCIYKCYFDKLKLFLFFGVLTAVFSFSFSNIPYLGIFHVFLVISLITIPFIRNIKFDFKIVLKNFFIIESSFILFNAWWLINLVRFQIQDIFLYYTKDFAISWVQQYSTGVSGIMEKIFSLKMLVLSAGGDYFSDFYNSIPMIVILFIPLFLIIFNFLKNPEDKSNRRFTVVILLFVLLVFFLNKGASEPLGNIYIWMLNNIPFFIIFKTPMEKFSVLSVFLLALALVPVFINTKSKWIYGVFVIYLSACSIPYFTLNFMPDYKFEDSSGDQPAKYISKKYLYKPGYLDAAEFLNKSKLDCRVLSLPGSANYQTTILNHDGNKYYRGMDPFLYSVNKPFITAYFDPTVGFFDPLFDNFSNDLRDKLLNIYNVNKIVFNHDVYPSFGIFREDKNAKMPVMDILSDHYKKNTFGSIDVFSRKDFLPHFYLPQSIVLSAEAVDKLPEIVSAPDYQINSVIYFLGQNDSLINERVKSLSGKINSNSISELPVLEYKKINPTKYRVIVHRAQGEFPLIFSERLNNGWKVYVNNFQSYDLQSNLNSQLAHYKILDGNDEDQAETDELVGYINKGWISTLGAGKEKIIKHWKGENNAQQLEYVEKYSIDYISKNFQGTIQNNNLPSGNFYETWFKQPLENNDIHAVANGYANSWLLDLNDICVNNSVCYQNSDGTYDVEMVIEFWPQRLFYAGLIISLATLLLSSGFLICSWRKNKKIN